MNEKDSWEEVLLLRNAQRHGMGILHKKAGSVFCWNPLNSDEFTIVFVGVHQDPDTLDSHFVLKESSRSSIISKKNIKDQIN